MPIGESKSTNSQHLLAQCPIPSSRFKRKSTWESISTMYVYPSQRYRCGVPRNQQAAYERAARCLGIQDVANISSDTDGMHMA